MAIEGRTHKPVVDHERCRLCAVCLDACPAELMPEMRLETESLRGRLYGGGDRQIHLKEENEMPLPRCQTACPLQQDIRGYLRLIANGRYTEALELIRETNPLPSICGYVCHHPCESACARGKLDEALSVKSLKRFAAEITDQCGTPRISIQPGKQLVSIIGSGPAGLTAGYELVKQGYPVEIVESFHQAGGLLAWAIPDFRLPRLALQRDIDFIRKSGVRILTGKRFGQDITLADLEQSGSAAVIIATGTQKSLALQLENEGCYQGYWECLDFLRSYSEKTVDRLGQHVIVVGGGNAAMDAARAARRLGSTRVIILYRRGPVEMPADPEEVKAALEEGVEIRYLALPVKFVLNKKQITGLECAKTELKGLDNQGRLKPVRIAGSAFDLAADAVISAVGQKADYDAIGQGLGSQGEPLEVDASTLNTNWPRVFAAGDFVQGPSTVVEAMASGKRAAKAVMQYLRS